MKMILMESWVDDIEFIDNDFKNLETISEWTYKIYKIENASGMNPERRDNMLALIERKLAPVVDHYADLFIQELKYWLRVVVGDPEFYWTQRMRQVQEANKKLVAEYRKYPSLSLPNKLVYFNRVMNANHFNENNSSGTNNFLKAYKDVIGLNISVKQMDYISNIPQETIAEWDKQLGYVGVW